MATYAFTYGNLKYRMENGGTWRPLLLQASMPATLANPTEIPGLQDFDELLYGGVYCCTVPTHIPNFVNCPVEDGEFAMFVMEQGNVVFQMIFSDTMFFRVKTTEWGNWFSFEGTEIVPNDG